MEFNISPADAVISALCRPNYWQSRERVMDADISQCHTPGNDWSWVNREHSSATAAQICQAGNYFISGERKNCIQKQLLLTFSGLLMVSLKFEVKAAECKPVGG